MKQLFMTLGREYDIMAYLEKSNLPDSKPYTDEEAIELMTRYQYNEQQARRFINHVKEYNSVYSSWTIWR